MSQLSLERQTESARHIEAILMVSEGPVPAKLFAQVLEVPVSAVNQVLAQMSEGYETEGRGFCLREVAGGWRFYSHPDEAPYVEEFVRTEQNPRLSQAALETLAIVAYKQPVSKAQLSAIRGVNCDGVVRSLVVRGLIEEVGRDAGPGQAILYGTAVKFLEQMGLGSLEELPPLNEFAPESGTAELIERTLAAEPGDGEEVEAVDSEEGVEDGPADGGMTPGGE